MSIIFFAHRLSLVQSVGLAISIASMLRNFLTRSGGQKKKEAEAAALPEETVNDGPKASLEFKDQVRRRLLAEPTRAQGRWARVARTPACRPRTSA